MLVDRVFGADLLTMFTVDYEPGGSAQQHDHPFEETYFFLAGRDRGRARRRHPHDPGRRRRLLGGRRRPRLLQQRHRAGPLDRDAGAAAARPPRLPLAADLDEVRGGQRCRVRERSSSSAARGRSGWSWSSTTRTPAARSSSHGRSETIARRRRGRGRRQRPRPRPSTSAEPHSIAPALADVGPVDKLALVAIDRDQNTDRRLRHRQGDLPRHAQARRLHRGRATRCATGCRPRRRSCCSAGWRRSGPTRARRRSRR